MSTQLPSQTPADAAEVVLRLERAALDRWGKGDPEGFLEISDAEVVYFDPLEPRRVDGIEALRRRYGPLRGKIKINRYELIDPRVTVSADLALLTYNFVSHGDAGAMRWNATEVYRCREGQWRIIHSHWSLTQPKLQPGCK
jgi:ketosteroid isomerase-like protein